MYASNSQMQQHINVVEEGCFNTKEGTEGLSCLYIHLALIQIVKSKPDTHL